MSKELFERRIAGLNLSEGDRKWFPKWLAGYASHANAAAGKAVVVDEAMVIAFLKSLRDNHVPAWRRLQATRAIECYQGLVLRTDAVDFHSIKVKLGEIARREKVTGSASAAAGRVVAGEGNPGRIEPDEPRVIQQMRSRLRVLHHPKKVFNRDVGFINTMRARLSDHRPVVLTKSEVEVLLAVPEGAIDVLNDQIRMARSLHESDLAAGFGEVYLPFALHRKYPNADREIGWQYVFPSRRLSRDPRSGIWRRHHVHAKTFAQAMKKALRRTSIVKPATPHALRHSFATHRLKNEADSPHPQSLSRRERGARQVGTHWATRM